MNTRIIRKKAKASFGRLKDRLNILVLARKRAPVFSRKYFQIVAKVWNICRARGLASRNAYLLGLYKPDISLENGCPFISKKEMVKIQSTVNPGAWGRLTEDKSMFYRYCDLCGVPIPRLYAYFFRNRDGWSRDGAPLQTQSDWVNFFQETAGEEFVIKPARGVYGKMVKFFQRKNKEFFDIDGKSYSAQDLFNLMNNDCEFDDFIIQERIYDHPDLVELSDVNALQTLRMTTFFDARGKFRFLYASMKIMARSTPEHNASEQQAQNSAADEKPRTGILRPTRLSADNFKIVGYCPVNLETGVFSSVAMMPPDRHGYVWTPAHPVTNHSIEGFQLPFWNELLRIVEKAAYTFRPLRTIGWDVAMTEEGPRIIEGNVCWDPPSHSGCCFQTKCPYDFPGEWLKKQKVTDRSSH